MYEPSPTRRFLKIAFAYDIIPIEHGTAPVSRNSHSHSFRDAGPNQIPRPRLIAAFWKQASFMAGMTLYYAGLNNNHLSHFRGALQLSTATNSSTGQVCSKNCS